MIKMPRMNTGMVIITPSSLMILRGVERWIIENVKRLNRGRAIIISMSQNLRTHNIADTDTRRKYIKEELGDHIWLELDVISYEDISLLGFSKLLRHRGIVLLRPRALFLLVKLRRYLKGLNAYIVTHDAFGGLFLTLLALIIGVRSIIMGIHSEPKLVYFRSFYPILSFLKAFNILRCIHSVNKFTAKLLKGIIPDIPVIYIPNGVDCNKFKLLHRKNDSFSVVFYGALALDKGVDMVVRVARKIKEKYPEINFIVISSGGPLRDIIEEAAREGIIEFKGYLPDNELSRVLAESHVAFLPSRYEFFGLTVLESMASGTPVVVYDTPGPRHIVKDGLTGIVVKEYDADAFVEALEYIYNLWRYDKNRYEQIVKNCRITAEKYCWENVAKALTLLLQ